MRLARQEFSPSMRQRKSEILGDQSWENTHICWGVWGESLRTGCDEGILEMRRRIVCDLWDVAWRERGDWRWTRRVVVVVSIIRTWWYRRKPCSHKSD